MSIIDKVKEKIKYFLDSPYIDELFWIVLLLFIASGSFALGMRYERETFLSAHPIEFSKNDAIIQAWTTYISEKRAEAEFFASKSGTVYYPLACPAGDRIAAKNRVYFSSKDEAETAGYKSSSRCH